LHLKRTKAHKPFANHLVRRANLPGRYLPTYAPQLTSSKVFTASACSSSPGTWDNFQGVQWHRPSHSLMCDTQTNELFPLCVSLCRIAFTKTVLGIFPRWRSTQMKHSLTLGEEGIIKMLPQRRHKIHRGSYESFRPKNHTQAPVPHFLALLLPIGKRWYCLEILFATYPLLVAQ